MAISPLGAVLRGMVAAAVGTGAMESVWYRRYKREPSDHDMPGIRVLSRREFLPKVCLVPIGFHKALGLFEVEAVVCGDLLKSVVHHPLSGKFVVG